MQHVIGLPCSSSFQPRLENSAPCRLDVDIAAPPSPSACGGGGGGGQRRMRRIHRHEERGREGRAGLQPLEAIKMSRVSPVRRWSHVNIRGPVSTCHLMPQGCLCLKSTPPPPPPPFLLSTSVWKAVLHDARLAARQLVLKCMQLPFCEMH